MHRRRRRGGRGRIPRPVYIEQRTPAETFTPHPASDEAPILLEQAELEALRLVDLEGHSQEEAGEKMGVSRGTVWRLLQAARKKVAQALSHGRAIRIVTSEA